MPAVTSLCFCCAALANRPDCNFGDLADDATPRLFAKHVHDANKTWSDIMRLSTDEQLVQVGHWATYVTTGSRTEDRMLLKEYISSTRWQNAHNASFVFDYDVLAQSSRGDITVPSVLRNEFEGKKQARVLSLGPAGSGLGFHAHGSSWLALLKGTKRWLVYPPGSTPQHLLHPLQGQGSALLAAVSRLPAKQQPLQCTQHAGDVVYIPEGWMHATMNIEGLAGGVAEQLPDMAHEAGPDAQSHVNTALLRNPDDSNSLYLISTFLDVSTVENFRQALEMLEKAVQATPYDMRLYFRLAELRYEVEHDTEAAFRELQRATAAVQQLEEEGNVPPHLHAAWLYRIAYHAVILEKFGTAIALLRQLKSLVPSTSVLHALAQVELALALTNTGKINEATSGLKALRANLTPLVWNAFPVSVRSTFGQLLERLQVEQLPQGLEYRSPGADWGDVAENGLSDQIKHHSTRSETMHTHDHDL